MAPLSGLFRHLRTLDAALSAAAPSLNQAATKADLFVLAVPDEATLIQVYRLFVARTTPTQDLAAEQPSDSEDGDDNFDLDSSSSSDDEPLEFASDASSDGGSSDDSDDNDESTHHYISSDISATVDDTSETLYLSIAQALPIVTPAHQTCLPRDARLTRHLDRLNLAVLKSKLESVQQPE